MKSSETIILLLVLAALSLFLSVRWRNKGFSPTGLDRAMGFSRAKSMALMVIGVVSIVLIILLSI